MKKFGALLLFFDETRFRKEEKVVKVLQNVYLSRFSQILESETNLTLNSCFSRTFVTSVLYLRLPEEVLLLSEADFTNERMVS